MQNPEYRATAKGIARAGGSFASRSIGPSGRSLWLARSAIKKFDTISRRRPGGARQRREAAAEPDRSGFIGAPNLITVLWLGGPSNRGNRSQRRRRNTIADVLQAYARRGSGLPDHRSDIKHHTDSSASPQNDKVGARLASIFAGRRLRWNATPVAGLRGAEAEARTGFAGTFRDNGSRKAGKPEPAEATQQNVASLRRGWLRLARPIGSDCDANVILRCSRKI